MGIRIDKRHDADVKEVKHVRSMLGVINMDGWRNEELRRRVAVREKVSHMEDWNILK